MCHVLIGFCPGSKRRFVFRAFLIYYTSPPSFLHFSAKTYCQSTIVNLVRELSIEYLYPSSIQLSTFSYLDLVSIIIIFTSLSFVLFILLDFHTHPSTLLDPSVLGFVVTCRQCLVRQVISQ